MRSFFISFFLFTSSFCFAQRQNVYFLKNDGRQVEVKDSADYIRIVREPDAGSVFFNVIEYYADGSKKLIGKSKALEYNSLEGICLSFYKSGKRKATETYRDGWHSGVSDYYYPNGKLHARKESTVKEELLPGETYPRKVVTEKITEAFDSLGTAEVKQGNGIYTQYNESFTEIIEQGPIVNGSRNGVWKGNDKKYDATFEEQYKDGNLISGKAVCDGVNTTYTVRFVSPKPPIVFGNLLSSNSKYPAEDREKKIQGRVVLELTIEKDGTISGIIVFRSPSKTLSAEAIRVMNLSSKWIPSVRYGIPGRADYKQPIDFTIEN